MKILLIGSEKSKESQQLKNEAEKRGHQLEIIPLNRIIFKIGKNLSVLSNNNRDITEFEAVLFRAINRHVIEAKIIARYMKKKRRIVVDEVLAQGNYDYHKFLMHTKLAEKKIPQPTTYLPLSLSSLKKFQGQSFGGKESGTVLWGQSFGEDCPQRTVPAPLVVKHIKKMHSRCVSRFDTPKEILDFFLRKKSRIGHYLIQEWYPAKKYYRVLVLGGRVLGNIERVSFLRRNKTKIPLAQRSKKTILTHRLKKIALTAVKATGIEFAGLDIMPDKKGRLKILEINRSPQFKRFGRVTGINVAEEVIKFIEKKGIRRAI